MRPQCSRHLPQGHSGDEIKPKAQVFSQVKGVSTLNSSSVGRANFSLASCFSTLKPLPLVYPAGVSWRVLYSLYRWGN